MLKLKFNLLVLATVVFNIYVFLVNYLNYNSTRGTDFDKYGPYLEYYTFGIESKLQEQGVGYFWFVSYISKLQINSLKISQNFESLIHSFGIHVTNTIFFLIGTVGIYFLLKYLKISYIVSLISINLLAVFPPLLGARMILKPEIMAFAFLPWIILFVFKFYDEQKIIYLIYLVPFIGLLISSKASIALMTAITLMFFIKKDLFIKKLNYVILLFIPVVYFLFLESFTVNEKFVWDHITPNGYDNVANLRFLFSINSELFDYPFRNSQSTSMIGILLLDTFGDYWQRYWNHQDGWLGNLYPGNSVLNIGGLFISLFFYVSLVVLLIKEKNKRLKKIGSLSFVGLGVLLITIFNVFPFFTKNFNPAKGDPIKTHYFSFFLALSLTYLLVKFLSLKKNNFSIFTILILIVFCLQITKGAPLSELRDDQNTTNKLHLLSPCVLGDPITKIIDYPDGWCDQEQISSSICSGSYNSSLLPQQKDDYLVFPPDDLYEQRNLVQGLNTVTVSNYFECINYTDGGYILQSSSKYFFNEKRETPKAFALCFISIFFIVFFYIVFDKRKYEPEHK